MAYAEAGLWHETVASLGELLTAIAPTTPKWPKIGKT